MIYSSGIAVAVAVSPQFVRIMAPQANPMVLWFSGACLLGSVLLVTVRRMGDLAEQSANARLGWAGERSVAEALMAAAADGFKIYHDVPRVTENHATNIDHVAISCHGAVVVETKTRSKPTDLARVPVKVIFDGEALHWPRYANDTKPIWQVKMNAEWLQSYLKEKCGFHVPVKQVIAIPGWNVDEKVLTQPRVVSGKGAAKAVWSCFDLTVQASLLPSQVKKITSVLDELCRDVNLHSRL
jgi:hypothetical protein